LRGTGTVYGMSITAKTSWLRLIPPVFGASLMASAAMAEGPMKGRIFCVSSPIKWHQLQIVKVEKLCVPRAKIGHRPDRIQ